MRFSGHFENNLPETHQIYCVAKILVKNEKRGMQNILFGDALQLILVVFDIIKQKLA